MIKKILHKVWQIEIKFQIALKRNIMKFDSFNQQSQSETTFPNSKFLKQKANTSKLIFLFEYKILKLHQRCAKD